MFSIGITPDRYENLYVYHLTSCSHRKFYGEHQKYVKLTRIPTVFNIPSLSTGNLRDLSQVSPVVLEILSCIEQE